MSKLFVIISAIFVGNLVFLSTTILKNSVQDPWEVPAKYQKLENPFASDADAENIGKTLYNKHCKSCHGSEGKGDGPKAEGLDTPTGDFTEASFKEQTDGALYYKTIFGRDDMPSFETKITEEKDRWLLINYLKRL
ncbi:c-type cytochrome [Gaetbulibacter aquiaggeris]|uniref:C-type cytochrome n=1 Tax=Gaetbulibacter aquiaggeris TaxID=1735373 RepID=A0ABW7MSW5_9FLAO